MDQAPTTPPTEIKHQYGDSHGTESLTDGWTDARWVVKCDQRYSSYTPPPVGPGDFPLWWGMPKIVDAIRIWYRFDAGARAEFIEDRKDGKVYPLSAPGGKMDLPAWPQPKWILRLPAGTIVDVALDAFHYIMEELRKPLPEVPPEIAARVEAYWAKQAEEKRLKEAKKL